MSFYEDAAKYVRMGAWVFPLIPRSKMPLTPHGCNDATDYMPQLKQWNDMWPDAGIAIVGRSMMPGDICILEFDKKPTLSTIAKQEGHAIPITRIHISGGKKLPHFIFRHTEKS